MKAAFAIASIAAVLAGLFALTLVDRSGDTTDRVAQTEAALSGAFESKTVFGADDRTPDANQKKYEVKAPDGQVLHVAAQRELTGPEIDQIGGYVKSAARDRSVDLPPNLRGVVRRITQVSPAWSDLEELWGPLAWQNRSTAKAKALSRYEQRPSDAESYLWNDRFAGSARRWLVEDDSQLLRRRAFSAGTGAGVVFVGTLAFVALLIVLWRFLLARLRELSGAIRGEK